MDSPLTTVHHALTEATQEARRAEAPLPPYTFRISKDERDAAEEICERHGTSLAAFFRACARTLSREYKP